MVKAIIFDFGGVIVRDFYSPLVDRLKDGVSQEKRDEFDAAEEAVVKGGVSKEEFFAQFDRLLGAGFVQHLDRNVEATYDSPNPEAINLIKDLKAKYKVGLLSNNFPFWVGVLRKQEYFKLFDAVTVSCETGLAKPDKEIYLLAAKSLGVEPAECVFVDDKQINVDGALAAGFTGAIKCLGIIEVRVQLEKLGVSKA